jgi:hypothetical protein
LTAAAGDAGYVERNAVVRALKSRWPQTPSSLDHEDDDPRHKLERRRAPAGAEAQVAAPGVARHSGPGCRATRSCEDQKRGVTTFIAAVLDHELGEPFRRDAMKKPVVVAGIDRADRRPQNRD